jgi:cytochrome c-type biogenesis protein CcmI
MILWVAILVLTLVSVAIALWPFLFGRREADAMAHAVAFYEARKAELLRLEAEGQISAGERAAAEAEQARRLIAIGRARTEISDAPEAMRTRRKFAAIAIIVVLPAIALLTYRAIGTPTMPDQPLASRAVDPQVAALRDAVRQVEAHLQQNPNDGRGHEVVAPVYLRLGRYEQAIHAFRRSVELQGETADRLADLAEALMASENGTVGPEARALLVRAVALDGTHAKSRFYRALATEQQGETAKAYGELVALANSLGEGGPRERVLAEIERFSREGRVPADAPQVTAPVAGPSSEAGRAIANMSDEDRQTAIRGMVEGLAARLEQQGGTFEEWYRVIQARLVLGEREKAIEHLDLARKFFAADSATLLRLDNVARAFGLKEAP